MASRPRAATSGARRSQLRVVPARIPVSRVGVRRRSPETRTTFALVASAIRPSMVKKRASSTPARSASSRA